MCFKKTVGVVYGGTNVERNISIKTGLTVISAIDDLDGYTAYPIFLTTENTFVAGPALRDNDTFESLKSLKEKTEQVYFLRKKEGLYIKTLNPNKMD